MTSLAPSTYYVDPGNGCDRKAGGSPREAWRSLERASQAALGPGAMLLLASGQAHRGVLRLGAGSRGTPEQPITIGSYGPGRATIDAGAADAISLTGCAHVVVEDLTLVGCGRLSGSNGAGVRINRAEGVVVRRVEASGFRLAGVWMGGDADTRIEHVRAHDNGFAGICVESGGAMPRSRNVTIVDCVAENNPGDPLNLDNHSGNGIVVGGVDGALIEYCVAAGNGWGMPRDGNGPVGIWAWNSDRVTIQHCIAHDNKSPGADGGGFDFDGGVTNSVMQHNLSYSNEGCGYLLCQYGGAPEWRGNVVRFNISYNDGLKNMGSGIGLWLGWPGISDCLIHNNTVVNPRHAVATLGDVPGMVYRNNVFVAGRDVLDGDFTGSRFEGNLYWRTGDGVFWRDGDRVAATLEEWADATGQETEGGRLVAAWADPLLALPAGAEQLPTDPRRLADMPWFRPGSGSPCVSGARGMHFGARA